jgi:hypothetical protein
VPTIEITAEPSTRNSSSSSSPNQKAFVAEMIRSMKERPEELARVQRAFFGGAIRRLRNQGAARGAVVAAA